jgi:hypothetical protein
MDTKMHIASVVPTVRSWPQTLALAIVFFSLPSSYSKPISASDQYCAIKRRVLEQAKCGKDVSELYQFTYVVI